ncbi:hypothetical protein BGZ98_002199 [Dissophora globulifera]|nr:hypothetical protein BGZ98_002199 [Dissophora globulifera]
MLDIEQRPEFQNDPKHSTENVDNNQNVSNEISDRESALKKHVKWAWDVIAEKEKVTMPGLATKFEYHSEEDAYSAHSNLIRSINMPQDLEEQPV